MKKIYSMMLTALLLFALTFPSFAAEAVQRVYDGAGLYTAEEAAELEKELAEAAETMDMEFIVVTTDAKSGKSLRQYADDFYDEGGFGTGSDKSGVLLLIDMEDRTVYMATTGKAISYFTDARLLDLTDENDDLYNYLADGDFYAGTEDVIDGAVSYYKMGIPAGAYTYNEETGEIKRHKSLTFLEVLLALLIPGVVSLIYVGNVKKQYSMESEKRNSQAALRSYQMDSAFIFATATNQLLNRHVTTRIIAPPPSSEGGGGSSAGQSTIHVGSSGTSHGGGGGGRHF